MHKDTPYPQTSWSSKILKVAIAGISCGVIWVCLITLPLYYFAQTLEGLG
jgi:hypothetical protein